MNLHQEQPPKLTLQLQDYGLFPLHVAYGSSVCLALCFSSPSLPSLTDSARPSQVPITVPNSFTMFPVPPFLIPLLLSA